MCYSALCPVYVLMRRQLCNFRWLDDSCAWPVNAVHLVDMAKLCFVSKRGRERSFRWCDQRVFCSIVFLKPRRFALFLYDDTWWCSHTCYDHCHCRCNTVYSIRCGNSVAWSLTRNGGKWVIDWRVMFIVIITSEVFTVTVIAPLGYFVMLIIIKRCERLVQYWNSSS